MERRVKGDGLRRGCYSGQPRKLATSRRNLDLQFGDIQDWAQREAMERRMCGSLLRWLGLGKPPQHNVRHTVWRKQLTDGTRQLRLGADRARQRTELEMLDGTDIVREVQSAGARREPADAGPESELRPTAGQEASDGSEWGGESAGDWIAGIAPPTA